MTDIKKLTVPFPREAIRWRWADKKQTRKLDYVEGHTVIHRLNDATDNVWNFTVDKVERFQLDDENTMVTAYVTLELPGLGKRSHIGVQAVNARGGEDLVKGAITDGLKKAATLFGVGLELYGPDYEAGEIKPQNGPVENLVAVRGEPDNLPARARTTTQNTVPTKTDNDALISWAGFYTEAKRSGLTNRDDCIRAGLPMDTFRNASDALAALREKLGVPA